MVTISTAAALLMSAKDLLVSKGSRNLFMSGLLGTCAHFCFVPKMMGVIDDITSDRLDGNSTDDMRRWLKVHYVRLVVADIPAWVAYVGAVLMTVSI